VKPTIGFRRNVYLVWLEYAAHLVAQGEAPARIRTRLDAMVSDTVASGVNRRQTVDSLMNIWVHTARQEANLHARAVELYSSLPAQVDRVVLHYGLALMAYPFFRQACALMGETLRFGAPVSTATLQQRLPASLGNLGALHDACKRVTFSLRDWGLLVDADRRYTYTVATPRPTPSTPELTAWLLAAALHAHPSQSLAFDDLLSLPELFPFELRLTPAQARASGLLELQMTGSGWQAVNRG